MLNLSQLSRKVRTFMKINIKEKVLFFEAFLLCGMARMIIKMIPFSKIKGHIGIYMKESPNKIDVSDYKIIKKVAWAVNQASKYTPWESKCLVQALTAQNMLKRRKVYSTLYLGVAKKGNENINAHAWLRCGQVIVTGGYRCEDFKEVAKFSNDVLT